MSLIVIIVLVVVVVKIAIQTQYNKLEREVLGELGFFDWNVVPYFDEAVTVKSRQTLEKYDDIKFLKEDSSRLARAEKVIQRKNDVAAKVNRFLQNNAYTSRGQYGKIKKLLDTVLNDASAFRVRVSYVSSAGNTLGSKEIRLSQYDINRFKNDPSLLMSKAEYNRYIKEQQKEALGRRQHEFYGRVNRIIDQANSNRDSLVIKDSQKRLDVLIGRLFDRTVNSIKKIKSLDSEEWSLIGDFIDHTKSDVESIIGANQRILAYYESSDFQKIKETCEGLMSSQREFNEYIDEKVRSISQLFGTRVVRNETINDDEYDYVRPYKKTVTPFTAEVSAAVFASAENDPLEYIVKYFYSNKKSYPEQIQKLYQLVEELETLKDAKQIIENYKMEYQQYLVGVPDFVMENDEAGFYSRLGFATIDESVLAVEYKFSYTSGGGLAQRSFTVPMTEETVAELIKTLENRLTASAFAKEQRTLMTKKLREAIKARDNYTCCNCGNSTHVEPNLLLEIDHIIPVSKGGRTEESNLQTLCWKCNRAKSNKIIAR
ncbi:MAG: HNH endonuclease [Butyricicoccus pullicaecorum]|nr:HNH endonuclease [Butyricicoccus pullicaecorum]